MRIKTADCFQKFFFFFCEIIIPSFCMAIRTLSSHTGEHINCCFSGGFYRYRSSRNQKRMRTIEPKEIHGIRMIFQSFSNFRNPLCTGTVINFRIVLNPFFVGNRKTCPFHPGINADTFSFIYITGACSALDGFIYSGAI